MRKELGENGKNEETQKTKINIDYQNQKTGERLLAGLSV